MHRSLAACAVWIVLACVDPAQASQPRFWSIELGSDFLAGETTGLAVESDGRLTIALGVTPAHDTGSPHVWAIASGLAGEIIVGTGNDGRVLRLSGDVVDVLHDSEELEVHAIAYGPDGRVYAATSPGGKVLAITRDGTVETFFDPIDRYIWGLAFDASGRLLVATGAGAHLYRVAADGQSEPLFESSEAHLMALTVTPSGDVYFGSSPGGIIYRLDAQSQTFAVHDSSFQEVKALEPAVGGGVYAALVGSSTQPTSQSAAPTEGVVTVTPASADTPTDDSVTVTVLAAAPAMPTASAARGAILKIGGSGEVERLWSSTEHTPHALAQAIGGVLVGTGDGGQLYRIRDDQTWSMEETFPGRQLTTVHRAADGSLTLGTSNPGRVYRLSSAPGASGTFISAVHDAGTLSSWGRLTWDATLPAGSLVAVQTRSGNTATPDATWSEWSPPHSDPESASVLSENARFLQVKAKLDSASAGSPVLRSIRCAYLQRNVRPQLASITVHPAGQVFPKSMTVSSEVPILGLPPEDSAATTAQGNMGFASMGGPALFRHGLRMFRWNASDANGDRLTYNVSFRRADESRLRPLRSDLVEDVLTWNTSSVPDGRYVIQVEASDASSNPFPLALQQTRESREFLVDNSAPIIALALSSLEPAQIEVVVVDAASPVGRLEYSVDAGSWVEVYPVDGIGDATKETYRIELSGVARDAALTVVVRAADRFQNTATAVIEVPAR